VSLLCPLTIFGVLVSQLLDVLTRERVLLLIASRRIFSLGGLLDLGDLGSLDLLLLDVLLVDLILKRHCCFLSSPLGAHWYGPRSRPAYRSGNCRYGSQSAPGGTRSRYDAASDVQDGTRGPHATTPGTVRTPSSRGHESSPSPSAAAPSFPHTPCAPPPASPRWRGGRSAYACPGRIRGSSPRHPPAGRCQPVAWTATRPREPPVRSPHSRGGQTRRRLRPERVPVPRHPPSP